MEIVQLNLFDRKLCHACGEWKLLSEYRRVSRLVSRDGHDGRCKKCRYELEKKNHAYKATERRLLIKEWHERNRERSNAGKRKWAKTHKDRVNLFTQIRRAKKRANGGSYTVKEWETLCAQYDYRCLACGAQVALTPDHIIPVTKDGRGEIENIQPLCLPCNIRKRDKIIDYRGKQGDDRLDDTPD